MDGSSTASSFYEAPMRYDEMRTSVLYEQVRKDFREVRDAVRTVQKNMTGLQKETDLTMKLINQLKKAEKEKEGEGEGEGEGEEDRGREEGENEEENGEQEEEEGSGEQEEEEESGEQEEKEQSNN